MCKNIPLCVGERNGNAPKGIANGRLDSMTNKQEMNDLHLTLSKSIPLCVGPFHIVVPCEGLAQINGRFYCMTERQEMSELHLTLCLQTCLCV